MAKCGACGKFTSAAEGVKCCKCSAYYDRACVALPATGRITNWVCPLCTSKLPRDNSSDTPVKGISLKSSEMEEKKSEETSSPGSGIPAQEDLALQMRLLREEIVDFRGEISRIRNSILACENRLCVLEQKFEEYDQRESTTDIEIKKITELATTVSKLQSELNHKDQELLMNDIELTNLPEDKGESTIHLVTLVATKLGISLDERDIVSAVRVGPHKAAGVEEGGTERARPRAVVVRLARRAVRDDFLRCARVRRGATTADMGLPHEPRRFYVNERLTRTNRHLFHRAREEGRRLNWRYVWTREGKIFVRQEQGKQAFRIKTELDINNIFKG